MSAQTSVTPYKVALDARIKKLPSMNPTSDGDLASLEDEDEQRADDDDDEDDDVESSSDESDYSLESSYDEEVAYAHDKRSDAPKSRKSKKREEKQKKL